MAGREVRVAVLGDASSLKRALADAQGATDRYERETARSTGRIAGAWAGVSASMTSFVTQAVGSFVRDSYQAGIDVEQAWTRVQGVFGDTAKAIDEWSRGTAKAIGLSRLESLRATGTFGNLLTQLGFASDEAGGMSVNMTTAAASLSAFHGADPTQVIEAMSAAFRGEYDALQRYIPAISDAALKQAALAMTGKANADELTNQEKAMAAYQMIMQGLGPAQGVFTDGISTMAEKQQIANARFEDAKARLGELMIPVGTWLMENFSALLEWWQTDMQPNFEAGIARLIGWWNDWRASGAQAREDFMRGWGIVMGWWDTFTKNFTGGLETIGGWIDWVEDKIQSLWEWIQRAWDGFQNIISAGGGGGMGGFLGAGLQLLGFDSGGVVPGPVGAPQLAVVHGGETVVPTHKDPGAMAGGTQTIILQVDGREIARAVVDQVRAA